MLSKLTTMIKHAIEYRRAVATLAVFGVLSVLGCTKLKQSVTSDGPRTPTSIIAVIADPDRFQGKQVNLAGFFRKSREVSALFPSRDLSYVEANGLWVDIDKSAKFDPPLSDAIWLGEKTLWLQIEGTIDATSHGHLAAWTATIRATSLRAFPVDWIDDRVK